MKIGKMLEAPPMKGLQENQPKKAITKIGKSEPETETESACLVLELGEGAEHKGEGGEEDDAQARPRKYLKAWNII